MAETAAGSELGPDKPSAEPRAAQRARAQAAETEGEPQALELLTEPDLDCIARLTFDMSGSHRQAARNGK